MPKNREKTKRKQPEPDDNDDYEEDNWCFECKDGGQLVLCDHENCGKAYHPDCVGRDDSFFDTVKSWVCGRHRCYNCNKSSKFCCLGCPNALCKKCVSTIEFTLVRGVQGLCCDCMEIVKIIKLNLDHDSEGNKITLDDRETYECLFKEYWEIVKVKEGLTEVDVSAAMPKEGLTEVDVSAAMPKEDNIWYCSGNHGTGTKGPFSMKLLKQWSEMESIDAFNYKVWMIGGSESKAMPLIDALKTFYP